ncbi:MAG: NUDIX domain-containing protein [Candidatus Nanohalobium sp.]
MPDYHLVAGNLIEKDGEYVLVQEGKEHVRGQWNVPAGSIEKEEEARKAAEREAWEEAGLEVEIKGLAGVFFDDSDYLDATVIVIVFYSEISGDPELNPEDEEEILDAGFFSRDEIEDMDLRTPFILDAIENVQNDKIGGLDAVRDYR